MHFIVKDNKFKIVLMAYGELAVSAFKALFPKFILSAIITPPFKTHLYRQQKQLPVEILAKTNNIPVIRTNNNLVVLKKIRQFKPSALVICSYNKILPPEVLRETKCINVHHGDLPRWRGRANFNWAIIKGRKSVGLTIHQAVPGLDAGNIYFQKMIPLSDNETIKTLYSKADKIITEKLAVVTLKVIHGYQGKPQRGRATYCCTRLPEDGYIDWSKSSLVIDRLIRGLSKPFPGAFTYFNGKKLIVWEAEIPKNSPYYECRIPGRIISIYKDIGVEVLTGNSSILIKAVQYENKEVNASSIIKSVKNSLGLDLVYLLKAIQKIK